MKNYPNPTFLQKASSIKKKRHTRAVVTISVIAALCLIASFVMWGAHMQDIYKKQFPEMVGAATSSPTTSKKFETSETEETTTEETTTETTETQLAPVVATSETTAAPESEGDGGSETEESQNNSPSQIPAYDPIVFNTSHPIQTISHEDRDVYLDVLKQNILDYMDANEDERISFRYVNLASNESLGINDLTPIIPAGAFALPCNIVYCEDVAAGTVDPLKSCPYSGEEAPGNNSWIADTYEPGKQFYLGTCAGLTVIRNDSLAFSYLLENIGGIDHVWEEVSTISSYINYTETVTYTDYTGTVVRGSSRSCVYDLTAYMEYLYYGYRNDPDTYLPLIGAMNSTMMPTPYTVAFGDDTTILHISGRNEESHSYTDVAIIDGEEPLIITISCECASYDRANTIMADLSSYLASYISLCHS